MKIESLLQSLGTLITLATAAFMLWKAKKMLPGEQASQDADAAKKYAEAAKLVADQLKEAMDRLDRVEERGERLAKRVDTLRDIIAERDKTLTARDRCIDKLNDEIRRRDALISEWTTGIRALIEQIQKLQQVPAWMPKSFELPKNKTD